MVKLKADGKETMMVMVMVMVMGMGHQLSVEVSVLGSWHPKENFGLDGFHPLGIQKASQVLEFQETDLQEICCCPVKELTTTDC